MTHLRSSLKPFFRRIDPCVDRLISFRPPLPEIPLSNTNSTRGSLLSCPDYGSPIKLLLFCAPKTDTRHFPRSGTGNKRFCEADVSWQIFLKPSL